MVSTDFERLGALVSCALLVAVGLASGGCSEEPTARGSKDQRTGDDFDGLPFRVIVARAYPADAAVHDSPLASTINPCQEQLHVALEHVDGLEDLDIEFAGSEPPSLLLSHPSGESVTLTGGILLPQSVVFPLDASTIEAMPVGPWQAELHHEGALIATVPPITRVATGDANLDGRVDSSDLIAIQQAGTYETGQPATWGTGDFTCDGLAGTSDLVEMAQGKEGVAYEGSPYVGPGDEEAWVDPDGKLVMTDYQCWLVGIGPDQARLTAPGSNNPLRDYLDYSGMSIDRECSEPSWEPGSIEEAEEGGSSMVFYDARVSNFVTAACAWGGADVSDANEDLATVGESWTPGHAKITSEGNAARDVRVVCEPFYNTIDDVYGDRFESNDSCLMDVRGEGKGKAVAHATSDEREEVVGADVGATITHVAEGRAESTLLLEFPNLALTTDLEIGASDVAPPSLEARGTAIAFANGRDNAAVVDGDNLKCRVGVEGGWGKKPALYGQCFVEITASEFYEMASNVIDSFTSEGEIVDQTTHVAWAENKDDSPHTLTHRGAFTLFPAQLGPVAGKSLGRLRVFSKQESTSNAKSMYGEIFTSEATARADGSVSISLAFPDPDIPDEYWEWTTDEQTAWDAANSPSRCHAGFGHRKSATKDPVGPEPDSETFKILERGRTITVGTGNFDRRYWIGRDGVKVQSFLERFGAW